MATITDRVKYKDNSRASEVLSASDYFPFGKQMAGRNYSDENYRYGFNGKEDDRDFGNQHLIQDYGFRLYNPEIGKFLSVDPLASSYPMLTPYQFASNMPVSAIDLDGLEAYLVDHTNSGPVRARLSLVSSEGPKLLIIEDGKEQTVYHFGLAPYEKYTGYIESWTLIRDGSLQPKSGSRRQSWSPWIPKQAKPDYDSFKARTLGPKLNQFNINMPSLFLNKIKKSVPSLRSGDINLRYTGGTSTWSNEYQQKDLDILAEKILNTSGIKKIKFEIIMPYNKDSGIDPNAIIDLDNKLYDLGQNLIKELQQRGVNVTMEVDTKVKGYSEDEMSSQNTGPKVEVIK
ncbi:RHS repeat-associated core domain-containing protein [Rapidithrix thailandica]|uniref:RHS repeat-associated core domain-containing protein n=1 Tax=Rapidithrix thailandica TaxID=413964 RepID=A0AAW9SDX2_9BACT